MLRRFWINPYINFSLRLTSGLMLFLLAAWLLGILQQGVIAMLVMPALLIGGIDLPSRQWAWRAGLGAIGFGAIAGVTAWISLAAPAWLTLWFASIAFLLTSCGAFGTLAARLAMGTLTMAVIGMATASLYPLWELTLGYFLATVWLLLYSAAWYRLTGHMPLRQALAATYRRLAVIVIERPEQLLDHKLPVHFDEALGIELGNCRRLLGSLGNPNTKGPLKNAFVAAVDLQERLQAVPEPAIASEVLTTDGMYPLYKQWTRAIAARLHRIARDLERGRDLSRSDSVELFTERLVEALAEKTERADRVGLVANYMATNARQIDRLVQRVSPLYQRHVRAEKTDSPWQKWRQMMVWSNPVMRGSVRMSLLLALASEIGSLMPLDNGYWILSTVVVVWQSSFVAIRSRAWQRAGGTFVGLLLALLALNVGIVDESALLLALLLVPFTIAIVTKHHGYTTVGVTLIIMLAFEYYGLASNEVLLARMVDTLIGCLLVLGGYRYLWPQWQGGRQAQLRGDALASLSHYIELILKSFAGETVEPVVLARARRAAYEQGIALNSSLSQMKQEPGFGHNVHNSAALLALYKGAMSHMNAIVPQVHKGLRLPSDDIHELKQIFSQLQQITLQACNDSPQPWPDSFKHREQWLFQRVEQANADRCGFVIYQLSLVLQRFHGIHQILLQPAPSPKAKLHQ
ncbi:FUSC family protein [uncultured Ferrimonas sp.]|uniref:FUSC family protein n=1 Tax=uncultured Ferrimonas sp. TaxID=432640 RepID=UPI00260D446E|nr:FUSC family protein [uncultured Ferrimonas sp.]